MMPPNDCYGSPPETKEQVSSKKSKTKMPEEPQMRSFAAVTPASAMASRRSDPGNTSARATRGHPTTRSRTDRNETRASKSRAQSQAPRKLDLSPEQQQDEAASSTLINHEDSSNSQYLLNLPPSLLPHWCALMICSALCLAAVASGTPLTTSSSSATAHDGSDVGHFENLQMVMAISTLSLMLTFLSAACYIWIPASFVGTLYEVTVIGLNVILWCGALPIIMNPANDLAVQGSSIVNGNLFALSWVAFFLSWIILKLVIEQLYVMEQARSGNLAYMTPAGRQGYAPLIPFTPYRLANVGLILSSLVVLVSSTRAHKQQLCSEWNRQLCKRAQFSMSVSILTLIGLLAGWSIYLYQVNKASQRTSNTNRSRIIPSSKVRLIPLGLLVLGWFLATGVGTFGQHAPAHAMGNFYLGTWISFGLSLYLFKKTMLEYVATQQSSKGKSTTRKQGHEPKTKKRPKQRRVPGLVQDDDQESDEVEPPISTKATDDMSEILTDATTPSLVTPKVHSNKDDRHLHRDFSAKKSRDTIAMSLEESFGNEATLEVVSARRKSVDPDPEQGSIRIIQRASTEKTEDAYSDDGDDASVQTPRRGSASRRSSDRGEFRSSDNGRRSTGSRGSSGENSAFYHERVKPMSIPFGNDGGGLADDSRFEEGESLFDHNGLSCSAITTAIDNTTRDIDVLIDPEDF